MDGQDNKAVMIKFENTITKRYYYLLAEKDLFDAYILIIMRGSRHRNIRLSLCFNSPDARQNEIDRLSKRRIRRGYTLVQ